MNRSAPGSGLQVIELHEPRGADFEALLGIYADALPVRERKDRAALSTLATRSDYRVLVAKRSATVVGFAIVYRGVEVSLLEYMGVTGSLRGGGIGTALYQEAYAASSASNRDGDRPLLIEVDSDHEPSRDHEVRVRRKAFYRRLGCRELMGLRYILPLPAASDPPAMDLLLARDDRGAVSKATVAAWLREIYVKVYDRSETDPLLTKMLSTLPPVVEVA
jgi:Acetyltransferase (GNAT) family